MSQRTIAAVSAVREAGKVVVLATARGPWHAVPYALALKVDGPLICLNGALVMSPITGVTLRSMPICDPSLLPRVEELARRGVAIAVDTASQRFVSSRWAQTRAPDGRVPIGSLDQIAGEPLCVMVVGSGSELALSANMLNGLADARLTTSAEGLLEVTAAAATKSSAARWITNCLGLDLRSFVAFGDMPNDLDLLQAVGMGVAMANGDALVQSVVRFIAGNNDDDGVARYLEPLISLWKHPTSRTSPALRCAIAR